MVNELSTGYFAILRWRSDSTRDEARNVAVVLVDEVGKLGGIRAASISTISPILREQGILDSIIFSMQKSFESEIKPDLAKLRDWHESLEQSIYFTEPKLTMMRDPDETLNALYRAYVAPRSRGPRTLTKGRVLDGATDTLRGFGLNVKRGQYIEDFIFDLTIFGVESQVLALEVLSFAPGKKGWIIEEHQAGHFLYALNSTHVPGAGIIQPPVESSHPNATPSFDRIRRWFDHAKVPHFSPSELADPKTMQELLSQ